MSPAQQRFWPDPQPLVERMGIDFFRSLPETSGVYMMHGRASCILYVGKAKNLRHRLGSYRRANPDRMPRRTVRLLHQVEYITWEKCADEAAALAREAQLIMTLKPRFNRAGVWKGARKFIIWRGHKEGLELAVTESPIDGWNHTAPMNSAAVYLHRALIRLLWARLYPAQGLLGMPCGWFAGKHSSRVLIRHYVPSMTKEALAILTELMRGNTDAFTAWLTPPGSVMELQIFAEDSEFVTEYFSEMLPTSPE